MFLRVHNDRGVERLYILRSYRVGDTVKNENVRSLGRIDRLCRDLNMSREEVLAWAQAQVDELDHSPAPPVNVPFSPEKLIVKDEQRSFLAGYLFLQDLYYDLKMKNVFRNIKNRHQYQYDLDAIFSDLVYARVLEPGSKCSSYDTAGKFLEPPSYERHDVYRALSVLAEESDYIQSEVYKNSNFVTLRNNRVLYYDCTNYYFEIEQEDDFRRYGVSKEHRPNPIVQMGLFMDADGIPLSFSLFSGNENEQPSMTPLEKKVISDFGLDRFVVCTDAGLSSAANRRFNNTTGRKFVTAQSIKKLKGFLQDFCLGDDGWRLEGSRKTYKISEMDEAEDYDKVFYKDRWINEDGLEQHLIVSFSIKYREYQRTIRNRQVERAQGMLGRPSSLNKIRPNDPKRFISQEHCTRDGEAADITMTCLDEEQVAKEEKYDGFYAVCTNLEDDAPEILKINHRRWEIEECFRIMKSEFRARPVYLSRKDRITAHFMTCFTALVVYRILEKKLGGKYSCEQILATLKDMNMLISPGDGYIPVYMRTDLTDALHEAFGFRTDYQIISQRNMKKICTATKK